MEENFMKKYFAPATALKVAWPAALTSTLSAALILVLVLVLAPQAWAVPDATAARAAELVCHRIERLANPGSRQKIHESYIVQFQSIAVERLQANAPTDPSYRVSARQVPVDAAKTSSVDFLLDIKGNILDFRADFNGAAASAPVWPGSDPITLTEKALHYVMDNSTAKPALAPYNRDLKRVAIAPVTGRAGAAKVTISSSSAADLLEILIQPDGREYKIISATTVKP
jgi:hypothetical protein